MRDCRCCGSPTHGGGVPLCESCGNGDCDPQASWHCDGRAGHHCDGTGCSEYGEDGTL